MKEKFSLKDHLFNQEKVEYLASLIKPNCRKFKSQSFCRKVLDRFPELELKERIHHMAEMLKETLPEGYRLAVNIIIESLPAELDPEKTDDDFGDFIFAPLSHFVALYGCNRKDLSFSLNALEELTKRFSVEYAIRPFLISFPEETLKKTAHWAKHDHYHVRRLASEGIRPNLPWGQKVGVPFDRIIENLDQLHHDQTRFVTRSVANTLNDISKQDSSLVLKTLKKWKKENRQGAKEMDFIINHSLRTLVKKGNAGALKLLGYSSNPNVNVSQLKIRKKKIQVGETLEFSFKLDSNKKEKLLIDYLVHFQTHAGKLQPKVFKLKKLDVKKGEVIHLEKKHPLREMTTKKLYPGEHKIEIQINGKSCGEADFHLK